ncbi:MAG: heme ABC transporter ATP-binding protein [Myxococcota bacterium]
MTLSLESAVVRRGPAVLLDHVSFDCQAGALTAICGPNGAGKSTALSLLTGATKPSDGRATLDGTDVASIPSAALARTRAVVAQQHRLGFPFLVYEVVAMGRAPHEGRSSAAHDAEIVESALSAMALHALADRNYLTLSGGERQRTMIARALAQVWDAPETTARWLLLDEPTAALDLKYQLNLMELLRRLADDRWGVVAVLHDLGLVRRFADAVVLMGKASVAAAGPPREVLSAERIEEVFDLDAPYVESGL